MNVMDDLVPLIDNGGQRSYVKRRCNLRLVFIKKRRSNQDRRKVDDRRTVQNQKRDNGPERRWTLKAI